MRRLFLSHVPLYATVKNKKKDKTKRFDVHKNKANQVISDQTLCKFRRTCAPFVKLEFDTVKCKVETLKRLSLKALKSTIDFASNHLACVTTVVAR